MSRNNMVMPLEGDPSKFSSDMKKLFNHRETSDIKFVLGPSRHILYGHRCILMVRCEVFRAMLTGQSAPKPKDGVIPIVLSDVIPEVFAAMLQYIYTNCVTLNTNIAADVLASSVEYGLDGLKDLCVEYLTKNLTIATACEVMQSAVTYGQDELRQNTIGFIETNTESVFQSKCFHELSDKALSYILQSDELQLDEKDILVAVKEWATVNSVVSGKSLQSVALKVIVHIRLPLFTTEELRDIEEENKTNNLIPVELFAYAWRYHALKASSEEWQQNELTRPRRGTLLREPHGGMETL